MSARKLLRMLKHAGLEILVRGEWHSDQRLDAYEKKPKPTRLLKSRDAKHGL